MHSMAIQEKSKCGILRFGRLRVGMTSVFWICGGEQATTKATGNGNGNGSNKGNSNSKGNSRFLRCATE
jgi:hypothetical protein